MTRAGGSPSQARGEGRREPSDHSLLRRFRNGSQDAAAQLYHRYAQRLRALARAKCSPDLAQRLDVEDIVQSVFASFFRRASQGYYDVPAGEELWKLFLVMALNKIRAKGAFHRAAKRDVRLTATGECFEQAAEEGGQDDGASAFLQVVVGESLGRLPPQLRQVVALRLEGYEVVEIAEKTQRSRRTVERLLQESRQHLAELLQPKD